MGRKIQKIPAAVIEFFLGVFLAKSRGREKEDRKYRISDRLHRRSGCEVCKLNSRTCTVYTLFMICQKPPFQKHTVPLRYMNQYFLK